MMLIIEPDIKECDQKIFFSFIQNIISGKKRKSIDE